ncbi:hypothetical protein [Nitrospira sp. Nam80]
MSQGDLLRAFESCTLDLRRFLATRLQCEETAGQNLRAFFFQIAENLGDQLDISVVVRADAAAYASPILFFGEPWTVLAAVGLRF